MHNPSPKPKRYVFARLSCALAALAALLSTQVAHASLVNQWTGDGYTSGSWVDSVGSVSAAATGTPQPVANAFGTHTGVSMNGGYFVIPAGAATAGLSNFTVVIVFKNTNVGPFTPNYYNAIPMAAFDIGGGGQIDWGMSYGGTGGQGIVTGVGTQNASGGANNDVLQATPQLALNAVHAVALQVNAVTNGIITYADGLPVQTNSAVKLLPRSTGNTIFVGGGTFVNPRFPGQIAAIQVYNDADTNCSILTSNLLATYNIPAPVVLPFSAGGDVGGGAAATISIPASASQSGPVTITLTSDNSSVVASTSVNFAKGQTSTNFSFSIVGVGTANVTASGPGVSPATMLVAGLDESGLANDWLADTYVNNSTNWVDSTGGVVAAGTGSEVAVAGAFGPGHQGVARNGTGTTTGTNGFQIPAGTAPAGLTNYTIAVVFKPTAVGPNNGNYYGSQIMFGFDIGGGGQHDYGMSWGGGTPGAGQRIVVGIGRNGGDSQIQSPGGLPLALNTTHAAVLQVNGSTGVQSLWVDGLLSGQNTGLTMLTANSQIIPMIQQSTANIGNAFGGLLAEVRVYNNANVNGGGLTAYLQNKYAGLPLVKIATTSQPFVEPGSNVTLSVTIPPSASLGGSFSVTLTSDNQSVAGNTNVTFAQGVTNASVSIKILAAGGTTMTASGNGLTPAAVLIGGLAPRALTESLRASSLPAQNGGNLPDGGVLFNWNGDTNGSTTVFSYTGLGNAPTYHASATPNGSPAVAFNYGELILNPTNGGISPLTGYSNYSIAMVFKATNVGVGPVGEQWYNGTGIMDGDEPGAHNDFGTAIDSAGNFIWGVGNSDVSISDTNYPLVSPLFHAIVGTWDGQNQQMKLYIDDRPVISATGTVPVGPRDNAYIALGGTSSPPGGRTDPTQLYMGAEVAEIQFYSGALTGTEVTNVINSLVNTYGLLFPDKALCNISAARTVEDVGSNIVCTVTIPQGANASHAVSVTVSSSAPGVVSVAGGASGNLNFAIGATNVQTINVQTVSPGTAILTAAASGLIAQTVTITVQQPPFLVEAFRASSLTNQNPGITEGTGVTSWAGDTNSGAVATQNNPNPPLFHASATPSGSPSVVFTGANASLFLQGASSPIAGFTNFSVALVFKASAPEPSTSANWYSQAGILDAEESGAHNDWGISMDNNGNLNFGIGNPDVTLLNANNNLVNSNLFHVAVMAFDNIHQRMMITVDDQPTTTTPPGTVLSTGPRDPSIIQNSGGDIHIGQGATDGLFWTGELVEADFYNGAIQNPSAVINTLKTTYGVAFQDQVLMSLTPVAQAIPSNTDLTLTLSIPASANASSPVTVSVTNSNPAAVTLNGSSAGVVPITFATGSATAQTITAHGAVIGTATLSYGANGLVPGAPVVLQVIENPGHALVGEWSFNDANHPYVDSSGFRPAGTHDGVVVGNVSLTNDVPPGLTGSSLNLKNTGALQILNTRSDEAGYLQTFDDVLANGMSISVWVKINAADDSTTWIPFLSKRGEDNFGYQLRRNNTGPFAAFTIRGTAGIDDAAGAAAYEDGLWHHIAGTWDAKTGVRKLYVDGFIDGNATETNDFGIPSFAYTNSVVIGARDRSNDGTGTPLEGYFLGLIKDVRIYNYALTQAQVLQAKAGQVVGPTVTLGAQRSANGLTLTWGQGTLQESTNASGPWISLTNASGYTAPLTNKAGFFRVLVTP